MEFCDEFNSYNSNNINNSILLHTLTIIPINSTIHSSKFTYLIAISHKHKDNMINETIYIESLNRLSDPNNNELFYSKSKRKFIKVVIFQAGFFGD